MDIHVNDILKMKKVIPVLAAPTGRAAQRMSESAGVDAKTIHRLLGYENGKFAHSESRPIPAKFVVIDESSMLDTKLASAVLSAVPGGAHLVLVGDIDQLPSVGAGNVLKDVINSKKFICRTRPPICNNRSKFCLTTTNSSSHCHWRFTRYFFITST